MSYLVVSDGENYKIAHLIEAFKTHQQVEMIPEGTRKKIKPEQSLYKLKTSDVKNFIAQVEGLIPTIDTQLLWDMLEDSTQKITINELAELYFGSIYTETEITSLLFAITTQNLSFYNHLNGAFTKCTEEEQNKRKFILIKQQEEQKIFDDYYAKLVNLQPPGFPAAISIVRLISKPDKHSIEYKALIQASKFLNISALELLNKTGVITDIPNFFVDSFLFEMFPKGINYNFKDEQLQIYQPTANLDLNMFSIDDKNTTEIDDAFSVVINEQGYTIGIHISAPALDSTIEGMVVDNISTIYYPGNKITMLPEEVINKYSLWENKELPVVSIYFDIDNEFQIKKYYSKLELVKVRRNLRIEELELLFNHENIDSNHNFPYEQELKILHQFANTLETGRGKPSVNNLSVDYNFSFENDKIIISPRLRGNPIDKLVSELMILANCTWGRMLTNNFIPAIYRVKQPHYPVKMTLQADSHTGLNVSYYTWATSPLRRASDYINQHQIINLICKNTNYYTNLNYTLLQVVEDFDKKYTKYLDFQTKLERYWSLKYLLQQGISEIKGTFVYKSKVQLEGVPIDIDTNGLINQRPKGTEIKIKILNINLATLNFDFRILD